MRQSIDSTHADGMCSSSLVWCNQPMCTFMLHLIHVRYLNNKGEWQLCMFVCCAVLRPSQQTFHVESVSEPNYTVHGQISFAVIN